MRHAISANDDARQGAQHHWKHLRTGGFRTANVDKDLEVCREALASCETILAGSSGTPARSLAGPSTDQHTQQMHYRRDAFLEQLRTAASPGGRQDATDSTCQQPLPRGARAVTRSQSATSMHRPVLPTRASVRSSSKDSAVNRLMYGSG